MKDKPMHTSKMYSKYWPGRDLLGFVFSTSKNNNYR